MNNVTDNLRANEHELLKFQIRHLIGNGKHAVWQFYAFFK